MSLYGYARVSTLDQDLAIHVVGDLPITDEMVQRLRDDTGVRAGCRSCSIFYALATRSSSPESIVWPAR